MKNLKKISAFLLSLFSISVFLTSCNNNDDSSKMDGTARMIIHLTDGPGDYSEVHVNVKDVMVKRSSDDNDENGWESIGGIEVGDYDLLELTGGKKVMIAEGDVPSGKIHQIRLVLEEEGNYLVTNEGETIVLKTPSAQQSGLKLKLDQELMPGFVYDFILDFDVDKSIVEAGDSGNHILKPVLKISAEVSSGIITGSVTNTEHQILASVITENDTISAFTDNNGVYMLYGVPAGTYDVTLTAPVGSGLNDAILEGVDVVNGETTDVGSTTLTEATFGAISGKILNEGVAASVSVEISAELTITAETAEDGSFVLNEVPAGTYNVVITPAEGSGLSVKTIANVEVVNGDTTNLEDISLE